MGAQSQRRKQADARIAELEAENESLKGRIADLDAQLTTALAAKQKPGNTK